MVFKIDWGNYSGRCSKSTPSGVSLPCTPELNSSHREKIFVWMSHDRDFSMATEYTKTSPKQAFSRLRTTRIGLSVFVKQFLPLVKSITSHGIDFLKVHYRVVWLVTSHDFVSRTRSTRLWRWFDRSRLLARLVVERHLNYSITFQVPLRQLTSLGVKFDLYGHFKLPLRSFTALTTLRSRIRSFTLRKAVNSTFGTLHNLWVDLFI